MKKYINIAFTALLALTMFSCTKKADVAAIEPKLPKLQLSSLGYQQVSPFTIPTTVLQLNFGATATNTATGPFTIEIFNGGAATTATLVKTVTFASWSGKETVAAGATAVHAISYTLQSTTYENTNVFAGSILLKLSALGLVPGGTYTVRATAYSAGSASSSNVVQTSFFKTI